MNYLALFQKLHAEVNVSELNSEIKDLKNKESLSSIFTILDGFDNFNETKGSLADCKNLQDGIIDLNSGDVQFNFKHYLLDENGEISEKKAKKLFGENIDIKDVKQAINLINTLAVKKYEQYKKEEHEKIETKFSDIPDCVKTHLSSGDLVEVKEQSGGEVLYIVNSGSEDRLYITYNADGQVVETLDKYDEGITTTRFYNVENGEVYKEKFEYSNGHIFTHDIQNHSLEETFGKNTFNYTFENNNKRLNSITVNSGLINQSDITPKYGEDGKIVDLDISLQDNIIGIKEERKQDLIDMLNVGAGLGEDFELVIVANKIEINPLIKDENNNYVELDYCARKDAINFIKNGLHYPDDFTSFLDKYDDVSVCRTEFKDVIQSKNLSSIELSLINASKKRDVLQFLKDFPDARIDGRNLACGTIRIALDNDNKKFIFDVNDGLVEEITEELDEENQQYKITINNFKNNIEQVIYSDTSNSTYNKCLSNPTQIVSNYYDENNNLLKTETITTNGLKDLPSKVVTYSDGKVEEEQIVQYDKDTQILSLKRNLVSPFGVETKYSYEQTDSSRAMQYKIVDKDGKEILNYNISMQKVSDNKVVSIINGHEYEAAFEKDKIVVLDKTKNKTHVIDFSHRIIHNEEVVMDILEQIPANQLIMMNSIPLNILYGHYDTNNANWDIQLSTINIGKHDDYSTTYLNKLTGVFVHEFGHYLDSDIENPKPGNYCISTNPELIEIFNKEFELFKQNTTSTTQLTLEHLIGNGTVSEKAAEAHMLLTPTEPGRGMRAMYFAQYFPETIAKVAELIAKKEEDFVNRA